MVARGVLLAAALGIASIGLSGATEEGAHPLRVELIPKAELPAGATLRLDQIAELNGSGKAQASRLELGRVPSPGSQRAVSRLTVQRALELGGFPRGSFSIVGPKQARVTGEGVPLERDAVRAALRTALDRIAPEASVTIEHVQLPRGVELPAGGHDLRIADSFTSVRQGANRIPLEVVSDAGVRRVGLYARLKVEGPVVVAVREVRRGQQVAPEDVRVERRPYPAGRELFHASEDVVGLVARSTLRTGDPVRGTALGPRDAVVSGQRVEAIYRQGGVQLVLETKARGSGGVGAIIPVTGQDGSSILEARVVESGRVLILGSENSP